MGETFCSGQLRDFVEVLVRDEDTKALAYEAISKVADDIPVARIIATMTYLPDEEYGDREIRTYEHLLYERQVDIIVHGHEESISFGPEERNITFRCISTRDDGSFTSDEYDDLRLVLGIIYFHLERVCVRMALHEAYLKQKLTGLSNTQGYMNDVKRIYKEGRLGDYSAFFFNIRGFGMLNYDFDENEADEILTRYAGELRKYVDDDELLGNVGGDNFVALIRKNNAEQFLQHLKHIRTYGISGDERVPLVLAATVGAFDVNENRLHHPGEVIGKASSALIYAKKKRKSIVWMTPEISSEIFQDKQIYDGLSQGIRNGDILAYFQPKVNLDTGEIIGAEALARWNYQGSILSPAKFVPILEKSTRISELDFFLLGEVCRFLARRKKDGLPIVPISVNFSRRDLEVPDLSGRIVGIIDSYGIERNEITVEVTETAYPDENEKLMAFLRHMQVERIATSVDDFGTGYSSLSIIREYPVNEIKIDRSFINRDSLTREDEIVVGSVISMAHQLGLLVITEGVETQEQVDFLHRLGCSSAQGFLFDRPLSEEDFVRKMETGRYEVSWSRYRR